MRCVVYWLYDENCVYPKLHGYVGITHNVEGRVKSHRKHGRFPEFAYMVLFNGTRKACEEKEFELRPVADIGWNRAPGGGRVDGRRISEALKGHPTPIHVREKIRKSLMGKKRSKASRLKQSLATKGVPKSEEHKRSIAEAALGRVLPGEIRLKISKNRKGKALGNKNALGTVHTVEARTKMSAAHKGNQNWRKRKPYSPEALRKMGEASKASWASPENRQRRVDKIKAMWASEVGERMRQSLAERNRNRGGKHAN